MEEFITKSENETTNKEYGYIPRERPIDEYLRMGLINLDKPSGPTSHEIDAWVKRILKVERVGHGGTLDPRVTGVLPMGINSATRVMQLLLSAPKEYVCLMHLHHPVDQEKIIDTLNEFQGKILQTPPLKSAVKRELRVRSIYYIKLLEIQEQDVLFRIGCEAGTYVRTYCHDIGEAIGVGAHMAELRRTQVGQLSEENNQVRLQDLKDAFYYYTEENDESYLRKTIMPAEEGIKHLNQIIIKDSAVEAVCHGANLASGGIVKLHSSIKKGETVLILTLKGELVASGETLFDAKDISQLETGLTVNVSKVFMPTGTYPKMWK